MSQERGIEGLAGSFRPSSEYNPILITGQIVALQVLLNLLLALGFSASWYLAGHDYRNGLQSTFRPDLTLDLHTRMGWLNVGVYFAAATLVYN
jgi:hypothetical protein